MLGCSILAQVTSQGNTEYLADSQGLPLCIREDECVVVTDAEGVEKWTLDVYIRCEV